MSVRPLDLSVDDLIQLPRFDAYGAIALGRRILAAANNESDLPPILTRAKEALAHDLEAVERAADARIEALGARDPALVAEADRALDACWVALFEWLGSFTKLPTGVAEGNTARALLEALYPDGPAFTLLPYDVEWSQSQRRLDQITRGPLGEPIRGLGGRPFVEALEQAHATYTDRLGIGSPASIGPIAPATIHEALESFASTLRMFALRVTAHVDVDDPRTAVLAQRLLAPLLSWQARPRRVADELLS